MNRRALCALAPGTESTVVEISNLTQLMILIVIVLLIFPAQQITSMIKSKIKRANVAKHPLNSMAVGTERFPGFQYRPAKGGLVFLRPQTAETAGDQFCA